MVIKVRKKHTYLIILTIKKQRNNSEIKMNELSKYTELFTLLAFYCIGGFRFFTFFYQLSAFLCILVKHEEPYFSYFNT